MNCIEFTQGTRWPRPAIGRCIGKVILGVLGLMAAPAHAAAHSTVANATVPVWRNVTPADTPTYTQDSSMTFDSARNRAVLLHADSGVFSLRSWDGNAWTGRVLAGATPGPSMRTAPIAYDTARDRIVLFGGFDGGRRNDTWSWDGISANWSDFAPQQKPSTRNGHAMVYDSARQRMVMTGGLYCFVPAAEPCAGTWEFNGTNWSQVATAGADYTPVRWRHAMAYDAARGVVVLFGGANATYAQAYADTWEYDGTAWTRRTSANGQAPSARHSHTMAYDSTRHTVVLYGGAGVATDAAHWEWDGQNWTPIAPPAVNPGPRQRHAMTYDSARQRLVLTGNLGGWGNSPNEVWELAYETPAPGLTATTLGSNPAASTYGQSVVFTATVVPVAPATAMPGGTVAFFAGGNVIAGCAGQTLDNAGVASCSTSALAAGEHTITAQYGGDASYPPAQPVSNALSLQVHPLITSIGIGLTPGNTQFGQVMMLAATAAIGGDADHPAIAGTIGFYSNGVLMPGCGGLAVNPSGVQCYISSLAVGMHGLSSGFTPANGNLLPSLSPVVVISVSKGATALALTLPVQPVPLGQSVSIGANVSVIAPAAGAPSGTIAISDGGGASCSMAWPQQTACTLTPAGAGARILNASFTPDAVSAASFTGSSANASLTVSAAQPGAVLASSANPSVFGQPVMLTATLTPVAGGPVPTTGGGIGFRIGGLEICAGSTLTPSGVANAAQATCTVPPSSLPVGVQGVTFEYAGDASNLAVGATLAGAQTVAKAATQTTLATHPPISFGQSASLTASVAVMAPGAGVAGGIIVVSDGATSCTITLPATSCMLTPASAGTRQLSAEFIPDATSGTNFHASTAYGELVVDRIAQAALMLSADPDELIPGMTSQLVASGGSGEGAVTYSLDSGACSVAASVATALGAGNCIVRATKAGDTNHEEASVTATVVVNPSLAPEADAQGVSVAFNTAKAIQLSGRDTNPGGPYALTYRLVTPPVKGAISSFDANAGTLIYTPNVSAVGADSFTFVVDSHNGSSPAAIVALTIAAGQPVTATPQSVTVAFNTAQTITLSGSDPNAGGPVTFTYALVDAPLHGAISNFDANAGTLTYTPTPGYTATDSFTFTASTVNGTSQAATVTLTVAAPQLALRVEDGRDFARYGRVVAYVVTLTNTGAAATAVPVTFTLSAGLDEGFAQLACVGADGGTHCEADADNPLRYIVTLPPKRALTWLVSVPVRSDAAGGDVRFSVAALGAGSITDVNTLVVFRDGFDVPYGDGTQIAPVVDGAQARAIFDESGESLSTAIPSIVVPARTTLGELPAALLIVRDGGRDVRIEACAMGEAILVRLVVFDASGQERASAWSVATAGAVLTIAGVADAQPARVFLLEGAQIPLTVW